LAWAAIDEGLLQTGGRLTFAVVVVGFTASALGLAAAAAASVRRLARRVAKSARRPSLLIGMRRLDADPGPTAGVVAAVAVLVAFNVVSQAFAYGRGSTFSNEEPRGRSLPGSIVVVTLDERTPDPDEVADLVVHASSIDGVIDVSTKKRAAGAGHAHAATLLLRTDGGADTVEEVRRAFAWLGTVATGDDARAMAAGAMPRENFPSLLSSAVALLLLLSGATVLVATLDSVVERRRALAMLAATGVPRSVILGGVVAQAWVPLAAAVAAGAIGGIVVSLLVGGMLDAPLSTGLRHVAGSVLLGASIVAAVTLAAIPAVGLATRPENLRVE
jgi:hypothetical protein